MSKIIERVEKLELKDFKTFKELYFIDAKGVYWYFCKNKKNLILYYFQEERWYYYKNIPSNKKNYDNLCNLIEELFTNTYYVLNECE